MNSLQAPSGAQLSSAAQKNHEELFPGHVSTFRRTDPEFIELFDNWAFDEVLASSRLDSRTRLLAILAASLGCQAQAEYRVMLGAALNVGVTPVEAKELVYQAVSYLGVARVLEFLQITNAVLQERGIALPLEPQGRVAPADRQAQGLALLGQIFGEDYGRMLEQTPADQRHIQGYLSDNCFGGYYSRGGLDLRMRELLTFVLLISQGGCEPQVKVHVRGNARVGNDRRLLVDVVTQLIPYIGYPRSLNALRCIGEVLPETAGS